MAFDPMQFIQATVTSPMSTAISVCPEGEWTAVVSDAGDMKDWFREAKWTDKKTGEPRSAAAMSIPFLITDAKPRGILKKKPEESLFASMDFFLDIDSQGGLDTSEGKNTKLGQLRKALSQNDVGMPWSFSMLRGAGPVIVKVVQESFDPNDPTRKAARIVKVTKIPF